MTKLVHGRKFILVIGMEIKTDIKFHSFDFFSLEADNRPETYFRKVCDKFTASQTNWYRGTKYIKTINLFELGKRNLQLEYFFRTFRELVMHSIEIFSCSKNMKTLNDFLTQTDKKRLMSIWELPVPIKTITVKYLNNQIDYFIFKGDSFTRNIKKSNKESLLNIVSFGNLRPLSGFMQ